MCMKFLSEIKLISLALILASSVSTPAMAYIDPNTGSLIVQILTPIIGIVAFTWKFLVVGVRKLVKKLAGK